MKSPNMQKQLFRLFKIFLLVGVLSNPTFGQPDTYKLTDIYTIDDGVTHNYINCVNKYNMGLMAIGTQNGLQIYDGYSYHLFNKNSSGLFRLNHNNINSIEFDLEGYVWIGSSNGLNKVSPFKRENISYFDKGNSAYPPLKNDTHANTLLTSTSDGKIWIVNNGIICRIIEGEVQQYYPEKFNTVSKIISDGDNNIYALSHESLICLSPEGELLFNIKEFSSPLHGLQTRKNMSFLFKTKKGEVILEDFFNKRYFNLTHTGVIVELTLENHWIPNFFKALDQQAKNFNIKSLRKFDFIETNSNLIWVATDFGLAKVEIRKQHFNTIPELDGISIRKLYGTEDGLLYGGTYAPEKFFQYNPKNKKLTWIENNKDVFDIIPLNENTLLTTSVDGTLRIFSQSQQKVLDAIQVPEGFVYYSLFMDKANTIWIGGKKGLFQSTLAEPLNITPTTSPSNDPVHNNLIRNICSANDSTLLLATNNGIIHYHKNNGTLAIYNEDSPKSQRPLDNLISQFIKDANGNIWISTDAGLNHFDVEKEKILKSYTTKNGLAHNIVYSMAMENDSILWLGTANGLSRFDINEETFSNYFIKDGLADNEFNSNSFAKTMDGKIYMGGIKGVTIIDPLSFPKPTKTYKHFVAKYLKYDSKAGMLNTFFLNPHDRNPIEITPDERYIEFYFVNEDFTSPMRNTFTYYLEGYEKNWIPKSNNHSVRYSNLPAGEYVFKLKSTSANGLESDFIFKVPLVVKQSFYKSWWFISLMIIGLLVAVILFYKNNINQERKITRLRNRMASDLHDEVSNTLNNIRIITNEVNLTDQEKVEKDFSIIQKMSSQGIEHVEDVIWSIDDKYSPAGNLLFKMEDFLDDVLRAKNISVELKWEGLNKKARLSFKYRRNMLLIFKEAISNIVKHTKPIQVDILYKKTADGYFMRITNTFENRIQSPYSSGKGLISMQQRAEEMGATITFSEGKYQFEILMEKKAKK